MTKADHMQEAIKLAISLVLFYWLALWMDWDMPKYGALAIVLISLGTSGASARKGVMRVVGTTAGLAVGLFGLALFAQDRWLNLLFLASYLTVIGYFMQGSRYGYAWFVAGFLPTLVWSTTYGEVDNAFHFAVARYLETSAGILIYTMISALLWPKRAGDQLARQGHDLWAGLRQLLGMYRRQLADGTLPAEATKLRSRVVGTASQMATTLQAAYADTPSVRADEAAWEVLRVNVRAFGDALALWHESIDDCRRLDVERLMPGLGPALDALDGRLARIADLWQARSADAGASTAPDDAALLEPLSPQLDRAAGADLPHFDRAAVLMFVQQLDALDLTSRDLLRAVRTLAGLDAGEAPDDRPLPPDLDRPAGWDPMRLLNGSFPAVCFTVAYFFWILFDPPTGPSVPNIASTIGLLILMTPMSAMTFLSVMLVVMWITVAPVYFFLMPLLDSGAGLLATVFGYAMIASMIGARSPVVKTVMLVLFVMMINITNQQRYSFIGLVDGAMMLALGIGIVGVVQVLVSPMHPERVVLSGVRRFFRGCARITGELAQIGREDRARAVRRRYYESMVLPVPRQLQAAAKKLDDARCPEDDRAKLQRLLDAMQSVALRFVALERARARVTAHAAAWDEPLVALGTQLRERIQALFERWSRGERVNALNERGIVRALALDLESLLDATTERGRQDRPDDRTLADLYAVLGCARGLVHAVGETQVAVDAIDWDNWSEARF